MKLFKKRYSRIIACVLAVLFLVGLAFGTKSIWLKSSNTSGHKTEWVKPDNINDFYEKSFTEIALREQDNYEYLGNLDKYGINFQKDRFSDISDKYISENYKLYKEFLSELDSYDISSLSGEDKLSHDIYKWFLQDIVDGEKFRYHGYIITQIGGPQVSMPDYMINTHSIANLKDAEDYITRLSQFDERFKEVISESGIREKKGVIPPKSMLDDCYLQMVSFTSDTPEMNPLYTTFVERVSSIQGIDDKTKEALYKKCKTEIMKSVYPAYKELAAYTQKLAKKAPEQGGAWTLPQGEEYYAYMLKHHTTTNLTPEEIHNLGLKEVARIQGEMRAIFKELGYQGDSIDGGMNYVHSKSYSSSEVFKVYDGLIQKMKGLLPRIFDITPKADVTLREVPSFMQQSFPNAYMQATLDGTRPGAFLVNTAMTSYEHTAPPLACHEAIPGHHYQIQIQEEMENVPLFRKVPMFTGYTEGWALYAETLGKDLGFYENKVMELGYLQSQLHRAARLVMDTGINYKKWTRDETIRYMQENVGFAWPAEIDRYIAWPGQACAYMTGELKILELREIAKAQLGDKFDIKEFHNIVLKDGALPFDILENQVKGYIASKQK